MPQTKKLQIEYAERLRSNVFIAETYAKALAENRKRDAYNIYQKTATAIMKLKTLDDNQRLNKYNNIQKLVAAAGYGAQFRKHFTAYKPLYVLVQGVGQQISKKYEEENKSQVSLLEGKKEIPAKLNAESVRARLDEMHAYIYEPENMERLKPDMQVDFKSRVYIYVTLALCLRGNEFRQIRLDETKNQFTDGLKNRGSMREYDEAIFNLIKKEHINFFLEWLSENMSTDYKTITRQIKRTLSTIFGVENPQLKDLRDWGLALNMVKFRDATAAR
jgi:hypothetical protein